MMIGAGAASIISRSFGAGDMERPLRRRGDFHRRGPGGDFHRCCMAMGRRHAAPVRRLPEDRRIRPRVSAHRYNQHHRSHPQHQRFRSDSRPGQGRTGDEAGAHRRGAQYRPRRRPDRRLEHGGEGSGLGHRGLPVRGSGPGHWIFSLQKERPSDSMAPFPARKGVGSTDIRPGRSHFHPTGRNRPGDDRGQQRIADVWRGVGRSGHQRLWRHQSNHGIHHPAVVGPDAGPPADGRIQLRRGQNGTIQKGLEAGRRGFGALWRRVFYRRRLGFRIHCAIIQHRSRPGGDGLPRPAPDFAGVHPHGSLHDGLRLFPGPGRRPPALLLFLVRQALFLFPLVFLLPRYFGITGIWAAMPASTLMAAVLTIFWLARVFGKPPWKTAPEPVALPG